MTTNKDAHIPSSEAHPKSEFFSIKKVFVSICSLLIIFGIFVRSSHLGDFYYSIFTDRMLWRASHLANEFVVAGSETAFGGQIPGGFLSYLVALILTVSESPIFVHAFSIVSMLAAGAVLYVTAKRYAGPVAAVATAAFYMAIASITQQWDALSLWNPSFGWLFGAIGYWAAARAMVDKDGRFLIIASAAIAMAVQIHLSYSLLFVAIVAGHLVFRILVRGWHLAAVLTVIAIAYGPYLYVDAGLGFDNLNTLLAHWERPEFHRPALLRDPMVLMSLAETIFGVRPLATDGGSLRFLASLARLVLSTVMLVLIGWWAVRQISRWRRRKDQLVNEKLSDRGADQAAHEIIRCIEQRRSPS